jgi:hypothetical protein
MGVLALLGTTQLSGAILFQQPTDFNGGFYSENDTSNGGAGNFATSYDNFTLGSSATIGSVTWVGSYVSNSGASNTITGVTISIWGDNSGIPDYLNTPLYTTHISGNAGETFLQLDNSTPGDATYAYAANINFTATGLTEYWLSIVPDLSGQPFWVWETATGGDGSSYQVFPGNSDLTGTNAVDLAFALDSNSVPEPGTTGLIGGGLLLVAMGSRRFGRG